MEKTVAWMFCRDQFLVPASSYVWHCTVHHWDVKGWIQPCHLHWRKSNTPSPPTLMCFVSSVLHTRCSNFVVMLMWTLKVGSDNIHHSKLVSATWKSSFVHPNPIYAFVLEIPSVFLGEKAGYFFLQPEDVSVAPTWPYHFSFPTQIWNNFLTQP